MYCDESLLKLGTSFALEAPLGVLSYHPIVGNLQHGGIQEHLSHGILDHACFYVLHSSKLTDKGSGPSMVALR